MTSDDSHGSPNPQLCAMPCVIVQECHPSGWRQITVYQYAVINIGNIYVLGVLINKHRYM